MDKVYDPIKVEKKWYEYWEKNRFFHGEVDKNKKPYSIVIPPPNVTGNLHMGHALNNTLQDIVVRKKRMEGYAASWIPGTDHAGIATQAVVEQQLKKEGISRHDLGRDKFIERVWEWKEKYGDIIINQLKALGCSCDWQRQRFTMDEGYSEAVKEVFIRLYDEGLIYRDNYIINWCPWDHTAISDIEVEHQDIEGSLWFIKYPVKGGNDYIEVATTRPETMLGDTAIAVNSKDKRFSKFIGKTAILPLLNREIPILADDFVDPKFGTGAVKVTPAHDPNDFEIGKRHDLEQINIFTIDAKINENGGSYRGMERFEAREKIVQDLDKQGLLGKVEKHVHSVGHCYRCDTVVEPRLSLQWFVSMKALAKQAIKTVKEGNIKFTPKRWLKLYYDWMENIRDWVISRQIWWGHRLPVFYCQQMKNEKCKMKKGIIVQVEKPGECPHCKSTNIRQDEDVLDTWFSSALWPFVTLGWPDKTEDLDYFYPTSLLSTGFDILYFWVARMIMMGEHFTGKVPFHEVYIHALIRDAEGRKMSKSRGNIIDPLVMIKKYGTDALRFTMASVAVPGRDVFLSEERIQGYRNFANKLWNASRFILSGMDESLLEVEVTELELADKWILSRLNSLIIETEKYHREFDFSKVAKAYYDFFWSEFADWYIEISKKRFYSDEKVAKATVAQVLLQVLETSLKLMHPLMPFITEEIWQQLPENGKSIMIASFPAAKKSAINKQAEEQMEIVMQVTTAIRGIRSELKINPGVRLKAVFRPKNKTIAEITSRNNNYISLLGKLDELVVDQDAKRPSQAATAVTSSGELYLPLAGLLNIDAESARLKKQLDQLISELANTEKKLANKAFVGKAPEEVVQKVKDKNQMLIDKKNKIEEQIQMLSVR